MKRLLLILAMLLFVNMAFGAYVAPLYDPQALHFTNSVNTITASDTTPSVKSKWVLKTANTAATTISDFDDGTTGRAIFVIVGDSNTTFDFTGTNLKGNGGSDYAASQNDLWVFVYDGTYWYGSFLGAAAGAGDMTKATYDTDEDGNIDVAAGGTEKSSWTQYCIPYLSGATTFGEIGIGTAGQFLKVNSGANGYEWGAGGTPGEDSIGPTELDDGSDTPSDEDIVTYEATGTEFEYHTIDELVALISEGALANSSVVSADIKDDTIDSADYAAGSIDAEHLAADIIDETKLADDSIDSEHYNDGSVDLVHINNSGSTLFVLTPRSAVPPATTYAQFDTIAGQSTPAEVIPTIAFDADSSEYMDYEGVMSQHYDGGGITLTIVWCAPSETTTTDECRWEVAFRAIEDDAEDLDTTAHTYQYNGVSAPPPATAGEASYDNITFTDGADMDNVDAGDAFILRVYRDHDHADDTCNGDTLIIRIYAKET